MDFIGIITLVGEVAVGCLFVLGIVPLVFGANRSKGEV